MCVPISLHSAQTRKKWKSFSPPKPYKTSGDVYKRQVHVLLKDVRSRAVGQHGGYLVNISLVRIHFRLNPYLRMQLLILVDDSQSCLISLISAPPHKAERNLVA